MKNFSKFIILFDRAASQGGNYDPDAQLFFNAELSAGVTLTTTEKNAVNNLVLDLKLNSLWSKMKFLYPFVGGSATGHKFNLKDPRDLNVAHRLVFNGGWTHSTNGALPNGTNGYASTFLIPNTHFGSGFASIGIYINNTLTTGDNIGSTNMGILIGSGFVRGTNKNTTNILNSPNSPNNGFIINSRTTSTNAFIMNRNGIFVTNATAAAAIYAINEIVLGANSTGGVINGYSTGRIALSYCSDFITQAQSTILKTIVQTFQTTLGRQV